MKYQIVKRENAFYYVEQKSFFNTIPIQFVTFSIDYVGMVLVSRLVIYKKFANFELAKIYLHSILGGKKEEEYKGYKIIKTIGYYSGTHGEGYMVYHDKVFLNAYTTRKAAIDYIDSHYKEIEDKKEKVVYEI